MSVDIFGSSALWAQVVFFWHNGAFTVRQQHSPVAGPAAVRFATWLTGGSRWPPGDIENKSSPVTRLRLRHSLAGRARQVSFSQPASRDTVKGLTRGRTWNRVGQTESVRFFDSWCRPGFKASGPNICRASSQRDAGGANQNVSRKPLGNAIDAYECEIKNKKHLHVLMFALTYIS